jgi:uncharacterized repeat protein (TIGR01451 family)
LPKNRVWAPGILRLVAAACLLAAALAGNAAYATDLQVSQYDFTPDPTPNGGKASFNIRLTNTGPASINDATVTVTLPQNFQILGGGADTVPAGCSVSGAAGSQTLTCTSVSVPVGNEFLSYTAHATAVGSFNTTATISSPTAADPNPANDSLTITPDVIAGADLSTTLTDNLPGHTIASGGTLTYTAVVRNAGPDTTNAIQLVDQLPPASDFTFVSASGTNWSCSQSSQVVTCNYTGSALAVPATLPPVNITGTVVRSTTGTLTNNATASVTLLSIGDPDLTNNAAPAVVTTVTAGTDLKATKTINGSSGTAVVLLGSPSTVRLRIDNVGPQTTTGATITDAMPSQLTIQSAPAGCAVVGQTVTCTSGTIPSGGEQHWDVTVQGNALGTGLTNSATVAPPAGMTDPVASNDTSSVSFSVQNPAADLAISKTKGTTPIAPNQDIFNVITVKNLGPATLSYAPGSEIIVKDTLGADETFLGGAGTVSAGWTCALAGNVVTCKTTATDTLAVGSSLTLNLTTHSSATANGVLTNTACTGATGGSLATPADNNSSNDCASASLPASTTQADLSIDKQVSIDNASYTHGTLNVPAEAVPTFTSLYIKLVAGNAGPNPSTNVSVTDALSAYGVTASTGRSVVSASAGSAAFAANGDLTWTLGTMASGASETLVIKLDRPFNTSYNGSSGPQAYTNAATIVGADIYDPTPANNSSTASYQIQPQPDVAVTQNVITANPAQVGVVSTYTWSVANNRNFALGVQFTDDIDLTRFELVGSPSTTAPGGSCSTNTVGNTATITCTLGTLSAGNTYQVTQQVRPIYDSSATYPLSVTNTAHVTTTSVEPTADLANNQLALTHNILAPQLDLGITNVEPDATYDPRAFGDDLVYDLHVSNFGPASRATNVVVTDTFVPPSGYTYTFDGFEVNPAGATATGGTSLVGAPNGACAFAAGTVTCKIDATASASNYLDKLKQVIFRVKFKPSGATPTGSLTFTNNAQVVSNEQPTTTSSVADANLANNKASQNTTVLPATDLEVVSKTPLISSASVNQPIGFDIVIRNNGVSDTSQVLLADQLPTGFVRNSAFVATATPSGTANVSSISCTGTNLIQCTINGLIPADGSLITVRVQALAQYPYAGPFNSNVADTATISPGKDGGGNPLSVDDNPANDSKSANVQIVGSSIAGTVFVDANRDNNVDAGEGKSGVSIKLTGTDSYGNAIGISPTVTKTTDGSGNFIFSNLPPGTYTIVETDPGLIDGLETAGTAGGTVDNSAFDATAAHNTISAITLPASTAATGYKFQEIAPASISGSVYQDTNNNGQMDGGESGLPPADFSLAQPIQLTGNDLYGRPVTLTTSVNASGAYSFTGLAPSDATGYTITELVQPTNFADGKDQNGAGNVIPNSGGRTAPETILVGQVLPGAALTHRDFGELQSATLSGSIFLDANSNAVKDAGETSGLAGGVVRLTGTDQFGGPVDCSITTNASGTFSFPNAADANVACRLLQGGTYTLTETPPTGFTHVGVYIGSAGGTAGGTSGANSAAVGAGNLTVSNIVLAAGATATNYNFAENGQGFAGYVYVDRNNNGTREADEIGIAGVTVTLSGTTATNQDVCTLITCTATTDAAGNFIIPNVPGSNGTGYTLTEQSQSSAPLSAYGDGQDGAGTVGGTARGTAGNDVISGIVLATGELGTNYRFGELASSMSGRVYVDVNNDGSKGGSEPGIGSVTLTLSGTTSTGTDICTQRAALTPALTCTTTTAADGSYSFGDLPSGTYSIVETQLSNYLDGKESSGTPAGTVDNSAFDASAAHNTIGTVTLGAHVSGTGYDFGELGVALNGRVYKDPQRDGVDSGGEPGIANVTVTLSQGATVIATTTTDANGNYSFVGLSAGTYTVTETQPAGYGSSSPDAVTVTVSAGQTRSIEFGDTVSTIAGTVFVDGNNDGVYQNGEEPISGVTVTLTGTAANGTAVNLTTTTNASGIFSFGDLLGGTYTLKETQPAAYADGKDSAGTAGGTVDNDLISSIALTGGIDAKNYAFGEIGQAITGIVYVDTNLNGKQDPGEPGVPGVTVALQHADGTAITTAVTGSDGSYIFPVPGAGDYLVVETQPAGYGNAAEHGDNRATVTVGTSTPPQVNFGERLGSLSGLVYNDSNQNGRRDPTEPTIPGVLVTLSGTDATGQPVSRTATTGKDGVFSFPNVAGGTYSLVETQPANYQDGIDTPGTAGGSAAPTPGDTISGIVMTAAQDANGYLFGEHGQGAELSGSVWYDINHNGARDPNEQGKANWTVQLLLNDVLLTSTTTDSNGQYKFTDLAPGSGYALLFREPSSQAAFGSARPNETGAPASDGVVSAGNPAGAAFTHGQLRELTLLPGANVQQQSLPLDPAGVVYDSVTRQVVPGAIVSISGPSGFDPSTQLLGGAINAVQKVGNDGFYQFLLLPGAPNGTYTLTVKPPVGGGYNPITPSTRIPPCSGTLTVGSTPDPLLISSYDGAPPADAATGCTVGTASSAYYLSFALTAGISANVVNNNLPIDPILKGALVVTKTTPIRDATRGGLVPYTITARNVLGGTIPNISIVDQVPAGFRYRSGSARLNGVPVTPIENGRQLTFPPVTFATDETKKVDLILTVGAGVGDGEHVNQAWAVNTNVNSVVSNVAEATVRIEPDADFDCTDILGKVFDDRNGNGVEDEGEPGLPGVRVVTVAGDLITTDAEGRYHVTCPMIANADRGSNFILKLDPRTLPTGYRMTTENPETVRLTRGKFVKLNFGAALLRVVRLDVQDAVFKGDDIAPDYLAKVDGLIQTLEGQPSVLRITYMPRGEEKKLVHDRVSRLRALIEQKWSEKKRRCRLIIETEERW